MCCHIHPAVSEDSVFTVFPKSCASHSVLTYIVIEQPLFYKEAVQTFLFAGHIYVDPESLHLLIYLKCVRNTHLLRINFIIPMLSHGEETISYSRFHKQQAYLFRLMGSHQHLCDCAVLLLAQIFGISTLI